MMTTPMIGIQHRDSTTGTISGNCLQPPPTGLEASTPINVVIAELAWQTSEMYGMIKKMHKSMSSQMSNSRVGIPELREAFYNLIEDHCIIIRSLADTLGDSNPLVKELELGAGHIIETADYAIMLASTAHEEPEDDWAEDLHNQTPLQLPADSMALAGQIGSCQPTASPTFLQVNEIKDKTIYAAKYSPLGSNDQSMVEDKPQECCEQHEEAQSYTKECCEQHAEAQSYTEECCEQHAEADTGTSTLYTSVVVSQSPENPAASNLSACSNGKSLSACKNTTPVQPAASVRSALEGLLEALEGLLEARSLQNAQSPLDSMDTTAQPAWILQTANSATENTDTVPQPEVVNIGESEHHAQPEVATTTTFPQPATVDSLTPSSQSQASLQVKEIKFETIDTAKHSPTGRSQAVSPTSPEAAVYPQPTSLMMSELEVFEESRPQTTSSTEEHRLEETSLGSTINKFDGLSTQSAFLLLITSLILNVTSFMKGLYCVDRSPQRNETTRDGAQSSTTKPRVTQLTVWHKRIAGKWRQSAQMQAHGAQLGGSQLGNNMHKSVHSLATRTAQQEVEGQAKVEANPEFPLCYQAQCSSSHGQNSSPDAKEASRPRSANPAEKKNVRNSNVRSGKALLTIFLIAVSLSVLRRNQGEILKAVHSHTGVPEDVNKASHSYQAVTYLGITAYHTFQYQCWDGCRDCISNTETRQVDNSNDGSTGIGSQRVAIASQDDEQNETKVKVHIAGNTTIGSNGILQESSSLHALLPVLASEDPPLHTGHEIWYQVTPARITLQHAGCIIANPYLMQHEPQPLTRFKLVATIAGHPLLVQSELKASDPVINEHVDTGLKSGKIRSRTERTRSYLNMTGLKSSQPHDLSPQSAPVVCEEPGLSLHPDQQHFIIDVIKQSGKDSSEESDDQQLPRSKSFQRNDLDNKQSQKDSSEDQQLPGPGGQEDGQGPHRIHASGKHSPVRGRFQKKDLDNKHSAEAQKDSRGTHPGQGYNSWQVEVPREGHEHEREQSNDCHTKPVTLILADKLSSMQSRQVQNCKHAHQDLQLKNMPWHDQAEQVILDHHHLHGQGHYGHHKHQQLSTFLCTNKTVKFSSRMLDMSIRLRKHVNSSQAEELSGRVCMSNLHTTAIPKESVPVATGDTKAIEDVYGQLQHNYVHNPLKSGQGEEQHDICTMLPAKKLDRHMVVMITNRQVLLQLVLNISIKPVGRDSTSQIHPEQVDIRSERTRVVWQWHCLSHVPALVVNVLGQHAVSSVCPAGKPRQHSDWGGQSQVSTPVEHQRHADLQHWHSILRTEDTDTNLAQVTNFNDGIGTVEDVNNVDQSRVDKHHNQLNNQGNDADVHINLTNDGQVQRAGQVLLRVQNTCKTQVMLYKFTKHKLPTFCSGSLITLAQEEGLSQAMCENIKDVDNVSMTPKQDVCQSPGHHRHHVQRKHLRDQVQRDEHGLPLPREKRKKPPQTSMSMQIHVRSGQVTRPIGVHYGKVIFSVNDDLTAPTSPSRMVLPSTLHFSELSPHGMSTRSVLSWDTQGHRYLQVQVLKMYDKQDTAYLHLGAACSYPLEFNSVLNHTVRSTHTSLMVSSCLMNNSSSDLPNMSSSRHNMRHRLAADKVLHVVRDELLDKGHCPDITATVDLPFTNSQNHNQPSTADGEMLSQQDNHNHTIGSEIKVHVIDPRNSPVLLQFRTNMREDDDCSHHLDDWHQSEVEGADIDSGKRNKDNKNTKIVTPLIICLSKPASLLSLSSTSFKEILGNIISNGQNGYHEQDQYTSQGQEILEDYTKVSNTLHTHGDCSQVQTSTVTQKPDTAYLIVLTTSTSIMVSSCMESNSKLGLLNMFKHHHKLRLGIENEVLMQQHGILVEVDDHDPTAALQATKRCLKRVKQQKILPLENFQTLQKKELLKIHRMNKSTLSTGKEVCPLSWSTCTSQMNLQNHLDLANLSTYPLFHITTQCPPEITISSAAVLEVQLLTHLYHNLQHVRVHEPVLSSSCRRHSPPEIDNETEVQQAETIVTGSLSHNGRNTTTRTAFGLISLEIQISGHCGRPQHQHHVPQDEDPRIHHLCHEVCSARRHHQSRDYGPGKSQARDSTMMCMLWPFINTTISSNMLIPHSTNTGMWACMVVNPHMILSLVEKDTKVFHLQRNLLHDPLQASFLMLSESKSWHKIYRSSKNQDKLLALYTAYGCHNYCTIIQNRLIKLQQMPLLCTVGQDLPKYSCVIQPLLVTHSMDLLSQHGRSPHGHLIPTGSQQHRDALEDGVYSRYSALTGQEDTHTIQEQRQHHQSLSQLIIYKASFGIDLEQHLAVNLLGNDQKASKYQVQQQDGLGHSHPHHQQGDGQVHHAHLLQYCSPEPVPEHHASRPVLSIRISVHRLQKLNNMQTKSCRISNASAEKSRVGLQKPTVDLDGPKHHLLLALHDGHHHLAHMKQELLSQCCTQQAGLSTCMMWPSYTLSTLTTTSMVICYMTAKGANKLALKETNKAFITATMRSVYLYTPPRDLSSVTFLAMAYFTCYQGCYCPKSSMKVPSSSDTWTCMMVPSSPDTDLWASTMVPSSPDTGMWVSMTVPSSTDTGMRASMTVPSSSDTGMWACMMVTSTKTQVSIYETGGVVQPLSYEHNQGILCQGLQEEAAHRGRGLVQCDVHQPPGTGLHSPIYKHRFLHHHLQISPTQARVIALLKLRLIHYISEDWGKVVRTEEVDNNVLHRIHGFSKFTITDAVMFSVSKATDEISCFSVFWYCDYQERMPYSYQLIILSSEDDIGNFVVIYKQEIVTAQLWL